MALTIGVDYGGVCSEHDAKHEDNTFSGEVGINVEFCLASLLHLRSIGHKLVLISFCGARRAKETREYFATLKENPFDEMYFVKNRKHKKQICQFAGVDVMIDDRLDILETIQDTKTLHFNTHPSDAECTYKSDYSAPGWTEVLAILKELKSLNLKPVREMNIKPFCYL